MRVVPVVVINQPGFLVEELRGEPEIELIRETAGLAGDLAEGGELEVGGDGPGVGEVAGQILVGIGHHVIGVSGGHAALDRR